MQVAERVNEAYDCVFIESCGAGVKVTAWLWSPVPLSALVRRTPYEPLTVVTALTLTTRSTDAAVTVAAFAEPVDAGPNSTR
jgi:hypothetical protein